MYYRESLFVFWESMLLSCSLSKQNYGSNVKKPLVQTCINVKFLWSVDIHKWLNALSAIPFCTLKWIFEETEKHLYVLFSLLALRCGFSLPSGTPRTTRFFPSCKSILVDEKPRMSFILQKYSFRSWRRPCIYHGASILYHAHLKSV